MPCMRATAPRGGRARFHAEPIHDPTVSAVPPVLLGFLLLTTYFNLGMTFLLHSLSPGSAPLYEYSKN